MATCILFTVVLWACRQYFFAYLYSMNELVIVLLIVAVLLLIAAKLLQRRKQEGTSTMPVKPFADEWRDILRKHVTFYENLTDEEKHIYERRVQRFLNSKIIEGVKTEVDDRIRLLVASSAIIPTFAFPEYNYPGIRTVLIYPNSFNEQMEIDGEDDGSRPVIGMLDNRSQNGSTIIFSESALIAAFSGRPDKNNVGIHEFVHLLDKADGDVDGIPEILMERQYVAPWLSEVKKAARRIEMGKSDINPYALTNNAEFLAVVSEYFFDNPEKFKSRHPALYEHLARIFNVDEEQ